MISTTKYTNASDFLERRLLEAKLAKHKLHDRNVRDIFKTLPNEDISQEIKNNALPCATLMSHVHGDYNLGNILRTSNFVFGGSCVFYFGKRRFDKRFTHGCYHYNAPIHLQDIEEVKKLKEKYTFVCLEQGNGSISLNNFKFPTNSLIIVGEEQHGIPPELLALSDHVVEVPARGSIRSLCVSSAYAMAAAVYAQQHGEK